MPEQRNYAVVLVSEETSGEVSELAGYFVEKLPNTRM
jgi:hypothetical protein